MFIFAIRGEPVVLALTSNNNCFSEAPVAEPLVSVNFTQFGIPDMLQLSSANNVIACAVAPEAVTGKFL